MVELPDTSLHVASRVHRDGPRAPVREPWSGELLAEVVLADAARADAAAAAAASAFDRMRALGTYERRALLGRIARAIEARAPAIAELIARESGKPISLARAEVARGVATFDLGAEEASRVTGEAMPLDVTEAAKGAHGAWLRVPAGPVLAISPFNFPLNLVAHKVAPALACGCSVVLKPPPQAPLTSLLLRDIVEAAGAPADALQVVPCDVAVAELLVKDARFATLSFTGSAKVGWHLKAIAGKKRVILELGGNAAVLVHEDAAPALETRVAPRVVAGAFGYAGQVCIKVQRLYVARAIQSALVDELVARTRAIVPTNPLDEASVVGPMIDEANAVRVDAWIDAAVAAGARPLVRGTRDRNRLGPTILAFDGDGRGLDVVDEEAFGPVLTVHPYDTWDDALRMADATRYGLQAGIFTDSIARVRAAFARLHVGGLIVNDVPTFRVDAMPYGGVRDSGLGREGVRFAIDEMTERKLVVYRAD